MRGRFRMLLPLVGLLLVPALLPALAAERVALVVGNADYNEAVAKLRNPVNDATAVAAALRRLGFEVIEGTDLNEEAFYDKIGAFEDAMGSANVALFFYAGHGLQVDGRNYLAPVDLRLERKQDLRRHAIELEAVLEVMRSETNLVILDACRNNPLAGELARSLGLSRAAVASRGLARVESASGTLIAYATEPGSVAADGTGDHSPYTAAFLEHLETPGLSVQDLFTQVTASVLASTGKKQRPWTHSSLSKIVRLVPGDDPEATAAAPAPAPASESVSERLTAEQLAAERVFWESVKDSTNAADIQAYLDRYPSGTYEVLARNRLKTLQSAAAPPPPPGVTAASVEAGLELSRSDRRLIQLGLKEKGFDPGPADGLFGRGTRGAIGRWQASRGEQATEYLDVEWAKLLLAAGKEHTRRQAETHRQREEAQEKARREAEAERQRREREAQEQAQRLAEQRRRQQELERERAAQARRQREEAQARARREAEARQKWEKLLVMVRVDGGSFTMGCQSGRDRDCYDREKPAHRVQVRSFEIGKYEVTQELWEAVMGGNPSHFTGCAARCPVELVSWEDVQAFLRKLNARTGKRYRLPTEAEWEYAARGGRQSRGYQYAGGNDVEAISWHIGNSGGRTHPVGRKRANELGLHDMSGNVHEWVQDCWNDSYRGAPDDGRAWERGDCSQRVMRGGSWASIPWSLRSAPRSGFDAGDRLIGLAFRIARTLAP